jgi:hypothetical protein
MDEAMRTYFQHYRFTHPTSEDFLRTIEQVAIAHDKATVITPHIESTTANQSSVPNEAGAASAGEPALASDRTQPLSAFPPLATTNGSPGTTPSPVASTTLRPFLNQAVYGTQVLDYSVDGFSTEPVRWWQPAYTERARCQTGCLTTVFLRRKGDFILPVTAEIVFDDGTRLRERWDGVDRWTRFTYTRNATVVSVELDPDHVVPLDRDLFNNSFTTRADPVPARKLTSIWVAIQQLAAQLVTWIV